MHSSPSFGSHVGTLNSATFWWQTLPTLPREREREGLPLKAGPWCQRTSTLSRSKSLFETGNNRRKIRWPFSHESHFCFVSQLWRRFSSCHSLWVFLTLTLAHTLDSLVRVSRRDDCIHASYWRSSKQPKGDIFQPPLSSRFPFVKGGEAIFLWGLPLKGRKEGKGRAKRGERGRERSFLPSPSLSLSITPHPPPPPPPLKGAAPLSQRFKKPQREESEGHEVS